MAETDKTLWGTNTVFDPTAKNQTTGNIGIGPVPDNTIHPAIPLPHGVCPSCGYCQCCGRSYGASPNPYITWTSQTGFTKTVPDFRNEVTDGTTKA